MIGLGKIIPLDWDSDWLQEHFPLEPTFLIDRLDYRYVFYRFSKPQIYDDLTPIKQLLARFNCPLGIDEFNPKPSNCPIVGTPNVKRIHKDHDVETVKELVKFSELNPEAEHSVSKFRKTLSMPVLHD